MKLLLDTGISHKLIEPLKQEGHEADWAGFPEDPGDAAILARAFSEKRILICLDKDFGTLAVHQGHPHWGIIRLVDYPSALHLDVLVQVLNQYRLELHVGCILTARNGHEVRIRAPGKIKWR